MRFEDYEKEGIITRLPKAEYQRYIDFHNNSYKDDLKVAESLVTISPRWVVVSAYYALHDITKLYLAKKHELKIVERQVHAAVISALRKVLENKEEKEKAIKLLEEAQKVYEAFRSHFKERILLTILLKARKEREKAQYYESDYQKIMFTKAISFLEQIVKPYIRLFERMLK